MNMFTNIDVTVTEFGIERLLVTTQRYTISIGVSAWGMAEHIG